MLGEDDIKDTIEEKLEVYSETAVRVETEEEFKEFKRICGLGGWTLIPESFTIESEDLENGIYFDAGITYFGIEEKFTYRPKAFYEEENWDILSVDKFYKKQGITKEEREITKKYFRKENLP